MCADQSTALTIQSRERSCNPVAPQGFKFWDMSKDFVLTVNAPWDASNQRYDFDGSSSATINFPILFDNRAFALEFTLTPKEEHLILPGQEKACIFSKVDQVRGMIGEEDSWVGFQACFIRSDDTMLDISINDGGITPVGTVMGGFSRVSRDVPINVRVIFNETHVTSSVDGMRTSKQIPYNRSGIPWDNALPLTLGAEIDRDVPEQRRNFLNAYLSDMQWGTYEELYHMQQFRHLKRR